MFAEKQSVNAPFPFLLWYLNLDEPCPESALEALSEYEIRKASSFAFERDRQRYIRRHVGLRLLLGEALNISAYDLVILEKPNEKPFLPGFPSISFSISHSGAHAIVAWSDSAVVGVDIEVLRLIEDRQGIADIILTASEQAVLSGVPSTDSDRYFLQGWTRKEACVKAIGKGLSVPLDSFEVGLDMEYRIANIPSWSDGGRVGVQSFNVSRAFAVAVAHVLG